MSAGRQLAAAIAAATVASSRRCDPPTPGMPARDASAQHGAAPGNRCSGNAWNLTIARHGVRLRRAMPLAGRVVRQHRDAVGEWPPQAAH